MIRCKKRFGQPQIKTNIVTAKSIFAKLNPIFRFCPFTVFVLRFIKRYDSIDNHRLFDFFKRIGFNVYLRNRSLAFGARGGGKYYWFGTFRIGFVPDGLRFRIYVFRLFDCLNFDSFARDFAVKKRLSRSVFSRLEKRRKKFSKRQYPQSF